MKLYDLVVTKKEYINQVDPRVEVSFRLPYSDWLLLEKSDEWRQVEKFLEELRSRRIQMSRQAREDYTRYRQPGQSVQHMIQRGGECNGRA